jgi:hypothetical protein
MMMECVCSEESTPSARSKNLDGESPVGTPLPRGKKGFCAIPMSSSRVLRFASKERTRVGVDSLVVEDVRNGDLTAARTQFRPRSSEIGLKDCFRELADRLWVFNHCHGQFSSARVVCRREIAISSTSHLSCAERSMFFIVRIA